MEVRPPRGDADLRGAIRAHGLAWRRAFDGVLPDDVLAGIPVEPTDELVRQWASRIDAECGAFLVATADGPDGDPGRAVGRADGDGTDGDVGATGDDGRTAPDAAEAADHPAGGTADVLGYAYARWGRETKSFVARGEAGLKEIYVHPRAWGEGVGSALLRAVLERVPEEVPSLKAEMLADNAVGERFYERRGFDRVATGTTEIAGDSYPVVVYALPLGE